MPEGPLRRVDETTCLLDGQVSLSRHTHVCERRQPTTPRAVAEDQLLGVGVVQHGAQHVQHSVRAGAAASHRVLVVGLASRQSPGQIGQPATQSLRLQVGNLHVA